MSLFWCQKVTAKKEAAFVPPPVAARLHLSQAVLAKDTKSGATVRLAAHVTPDDDEDSDGPPQTAADEGETVVVCALTPQQPAAALDLLFDSYTEFTVIGPADAEVHLTGYYLPVEEEEDEEDARGADPTIFDDDSDDEDFLVGNYGGDGDAGPGVPRLADGTPVRHVSIEDLDSDQEMGSEEIDSDLAGSDDSDDEDDDSDDEDDEDEGGAQRPNVVIQELGPDGKPVEESSDEEEEGEDSEDSEEEDSEEEPEPAPQPSSKKRPAAAQPATTPAKKAALSTPAKADKTPAKADKTPAKKPDKTPAKKETGGQAEEGTPGRLGKGMVREFDNGFKMEAMEVSRDPAAKVAKQGKRVVVKYVGKLQKTGKVFDQTRGKATFTFRLGVGEVIKGWDRGVAGMRVGDKRRLTVPPQMAYGSSGVKGAIPPNSTLMFDVELVDVK
ncbi:unnamed protein product [Pedinophyceae sp. YPF-701]|nr:unnamed protein product [Pedinophyceae sp. YPF-701]